MRSIEEHFAAVERYLSGGDERRVIDVLRERGFVVKRAKRLSDSQLRRALRELIHQLAEVNVFLDATDHLSDAELYHAIFKKVLPKKMNIGGGDWDVHDFVADEDGFEARMAYYADEQTRASYATWTDVPPRRLKPHDRDRHLPRPCDWDFYRIREYCVPEA